MSVKFLLDENVEHEVLHRLEKYDYTVEHVELHPDLGKGTEDTSIAVFSQRQDWVIVTQDADFVKDHDETDYYGAIYFEDATLSAMQMSDILHRMASNYPVSAFEGLEFGSTEWL